jgi:hypothetical protein
MFQKLVTASEEEEEEQQEIPLFPHISPDGVDRDFPLLCFTL